MDLSNGRYAVLDLSSGDVQERELPEMYAHNPRGVMSVIDAAVSDAGSAGFAISSGILTGSLVPASCAGFIRLPSARSESMRTCPLTGFMGVELKLTGFDFVVITGRADQDGYVWIRDGICEFVPSPGTRELHSWKRTDKIRSDQGDGKIQVIACGPWGDGGLAASQLTMNYWGGEDMIGAAAEFGRMGLSAVAFRGMGELELHDAEGHLSKSSALMRFHLKSLGANDGLASFSEIAARDDFRKHLHRNVGCYACPFPCRSYYKMREDPSVMRLENREPGSLVYDVPSVEMMASLGMSAIETIESLILCARYGAEPMASVSALQAREGKVDVAALEAMLGSLGPSEPWGGSTKGGFRESFDDPRDYELCLSLGLCPRYWARAGLDRDSITAVVEPALGAKLDLG
jgi:hypothetical protein